MQKLDLYISKEAPKAKNAAWLKPVEGGVALYALFGGKWQSLKVVNDNNTEDPEDDIVQNLIGSVQDEGKKNTINGAKSYAKEVCKSLEKDLKAYVDDKIKELD